MNLFKKKKESGLLLKYQSRAIENLSKFTEIQGKTILEIGGTANLAYTYENGKLSFTYEKDDFRLDREAESYAITIYKKVSSGEWKIIKRIWTDMNK